MTKYLLIIMNSDYMKMTEDILRKNNVSFNRRCNLYSNDDMYVKPRHYNRIFNKTTMFDVYMDKELKDKLMSDYEFMSFIKYEVEI